MTGLAFAVSCPVDGGRLSIIAQAEPTTYRSTAMCRCDTCRSEMQVIVGLDVIRNSRFGHSLDRGGL